MPPVSQSRSLTSHLRSLRFWCDLAGLAIIWLMVWWLDESLMWLGILPVTLIIKLMGLIGLLELFGFVAFHWFGATRGILLQGFTGGLMSSTAVFIQLTQADRVKTNSIHTLTRALLLAMLAMLMECLVIVLSIVPSELFWHNSLPLLAQALCITAAIWVLPSSNEPKGKDFDSIDTFNHPILWRRVWRFAALIVGLTLGIRWLNSYLQLPLVTSSFFLSLFEAHTVLAAAMLTVSQSSGLQDGLPLVMAIILGSTISKSLLVLRTGHRPLITHLLGVLLLSLLVVLGVFWWLRWL